MRDLLVSNMCNLSIGMLKNPPSKIQPKNVGWFMVHDSVYKFGDAQETCSHHPRNFSSSWFPIGKKYKVAATEQHTIGSRWLHKNKSLTKWWFQTFFIFTPILGEMIKIWLAHIFQMGWGKTTNWLSSLKFITLLETNISPTSRHFWVDDLPFPQVGYVSSLLGGSFQLVSS